MNPIDDDKNYKWGIFYNNPKDHRILVPKRIRMNGYTFNFAKPKGLLVLIFFAILLASLTFLLTKAI